MKSAHLTMLVLAAGLTARADFSFTMTQKSGPGNGQVVKYAVKGQKEMEARGGITSIKDFDAQTVTTIDHGARTYKVVRFSDLGSKAAMTDVQVNVESTGQKKTINGYNASQVLLTMQVDVPQAQQPGAKAQVAVEIWVSRDVPGSQDLLAFYKRNAANWPVAGAVGSSSMQQAISKLQQQFAQLDGVPVMEVIRMQMGAAGPNAAQAQQMDAARAKLEALANGGGPGAAGAQQALARMNAMTGGSGSLFDITLEAGNFSSAPVPDSTFAIPAGYQKVDQ